MLDLVLRTDAGIAGLLLRLTIAVVFFPHGAQKLFGWFGGYGYAGTMGFFKGLGVPVVAGFVGILAESIGPVFLAVGLGSRIVAVLLIGVMLGAITLVHRPHGFFTNWYGKLAAGQEGFEFHVLAIGALTALLVMGSGGWSLDALLAAR